MNGRTITLGIVGALALAGARRAAGSRATDGWSTWTTEDTESLVRAIDALRPFGSRWAHHAALEYKQAILDAYERLPASGQAAMQKAIRLSWKEEGFVSGRRPLFRTPSQREREHPGGPPGGLSLSHKATSGRAYATMDNVRVFLVLPEEVLLDSRVPRPHTDGWYARFNAWDPPTYDRRTGKPTNRRSQMSDLDQRAFGYSPTWTPQYGVEDEVILRPGVNPPEISYTEYLSRQGSGSAARTNPPSIGRITIESGEDAMVWRKVGVNVAPEESDYEVAVDASGAVVGASTFGWKNEGDFEDGELEDEERRVATFSVGVLPRARRRGVARRLVKRILAAHPGTDFRVWVVSPHMAALLEDLGFSTDGHEWTPDSPHMTYRTPTRAEARRRRLARVEQEARAAIQAARPPAAQLQPATYFATHRGPVTLEHLRLPEGQLVEARADRTRYANNPAERREKVAQLLLERAILIPGKSRLAMSDKWQIVLKVDPLGRDESRSERSDRLVRKP